MRSPRPARTVAVSRRQRNRLPTYERIEAVVLLGFAAVYFKIFDASIKAVFGGDIVFMTQCQQLTVEFRPQFNTRAVVGKKDRRKKLLHPGKPML